MLSIFGRHAREFARAIANHRYEKNDAGIYFPEQRAQASGIYILEQNGVEIERCPNLIPTEGLNAILDVLGGNLSVPTMYITLYANALTPIATHTASGFNAAYSEITSGTEGYTQANRVTWVDSGTAASGALNNYASPAAFTIATASSLTVNGAAMLTNSTKGSTSGKLISASRFTAARTFSDTDEFNVKYQLGLTAS